MFSQALIRSQLKRLDQNNALRVENCHFLTEHLSQIPGLETPLVPQEFEPVYYNYEIAFDPKTLGLDISAGELRQKVGDRKLIWTPGVNLAVGDGEMGQRYGDPREAVLAGSDGIIVGSGIYKSEEKAEVAKAYADISWQALLARGGA